MHSSTLIAGLAFLASLVMTEFYRRFALASGHLDRPNERSSHTVPTPRGGGVAIVLSSLGGFAWLWAAGNLGAATLAALLAGAPVALIGYVDDRRPVLARVRLAIHLLAAACAVLVLNDASNAFDPRSAAGLGALLILALGTVWSVNLFNFMDGIDGIAAAEAAFVAVGGAALTSLSNGAADSVAGGLVFGAAVLGFLLRNWPPARIFMGDVGSGYLGFVIAVLALLGAAQRRADFYIWLILSAAFVADAMVTLITRFIRGEAVATAHRSHTYQRLARRWHSHRRVTVGFVCVNVLWLLPLATLATFHPALGPYLASIAFVPLITIALLAGAGRADPVSK